MRHTVRTSSSDHGFELNLVDGVARWASNDAVLMPDVVDEYNVAELPGFDLEKHFAEYCAYVQRVTAAYRAARETLTPEQRAEEALERRAAFGAGVDIVDVITGERFRT